MAETTATTPSTNATKGNSWVSQHKTALIGGGIAVAAIFLFLFGVARHPAGFVQPSGDQLANMIQANAPTNNNNAGTGQLLNSLSGRTFFG